MRRGVERELRSLTSTLSVASGRECWNHSEGRGTAASHNPVLGEVAQTTCEGENRKRDNFTTLTKSNVNTKTNYKGVTEV